MPKWFKEKCRKKYEEFYPWWEDNWKLGIPRWHKDKISYTDWRNASYGISRLEGMLQFMESEDWSIRLPEMQEFIKQCDVQRKLNFNDIFPDMKEIFL